MTARSTVPPAVQSLIESVYDGMADDAQVRHLESLLLADPEACTYYVDFLNLNAELQWLARSQEEGNATVDKLAAEQTSLRCLPFEACDGAWQATSGYFSSGWPVAYLVASVILGLGLLIGGLVHVSQPVEIVLPSPDKRERAEGEGGQNQLVSSIVGRITGMVDCVWEGSGGRVQGAESDNQKSEIRNQKSVVALGDRFALRSGLLEITYDTGAKVILQGPVTYQVDSVAGGYLSVGKLTARLEKKAEGGRRKAEEADHPNSPFPLHPSTFAVTTPTAIVTDLGTEFGVEVDNSGTTAAYVFRGAVNVRPVGNEARSHQAILLTAGEAVKVENDTDRNHVIIHDVPVSGACFVRSEQFSQDTHESRQKVTSKALQQWQAHSRELRRDPSLLAYYDFQRQPNDSSRLANVAENGNGSFSGVIRNARWVTGRMAGKDALEFNGAHDYVAINLPQRVHDLTLLANVRVESIDNQFTSLLMSDDWSRPNEVHWQLVWDGCMDIHVGNGVAKSSQIFTEWKLSRWCRLAAVCSCKSGQIKLFCDGAVVGESSFPKDGTFYIGPAWIGRWNAGSFDPGSDIRIRNFHGRIDELAIFGRPLSDADIRTIFESGPPTSGQLRHDNATGTSKKK